MSTRGKNMLIFIGEQLLFSFLSIFFAYSFGKMIGKHSVVFSLITAFFYVTSCYSAGWSVSKKAYGAALEEKKKSGKEDLRLNYRIWDGFIIALPGFAITAVLAFLALTKGQMWEVIYRLFCYVFIYVITSVDYELIVLNVIICTLLPYLAYSLGYIAGKYRKILFIKYIPAFIYKSNEK